MREIKKVTEMHTYKLHGDWLLDITKERNYDINRHAFETWCAYLYKDRETHRVFVYGECVKQHLKKDNGKLSIVTLEQFKETIEFLLYEEDCYISSFADWHNEVDALEEFHEKWLDENEEAITAWREARGY